MKIQAFLVVTLCYLRTRFDVPEHFNIQRYLL